MRILIPPQSRRAQDILGTAGKGQTRCYDMREKID